MEFVAALVVLACLVALFGWSSWRLGPPRFYFGGRWILWFAAAILAVMVVAVLIERAG